MVMAILYTVAKIWKQYESLSTDEGIKKKNASEVGKKEFYL